MLACRSVRFLLWLLLFGSCSTDPAYFGVQMCIRNLPHSKPFNEALMLRNLCRTHLHLDCTALQAACSMNEAFFAPFPKSPYEHHGWRGGHVTCVVTGTKAMEFVQSLYILIEFSVVKSDSWLDRRVSFCSYLSNTVCTKKPLCGCYEFLPLQMTHRRSQMVRSCARCVAHHVTLSQMSPKAPVYITCAACRVVVKGGYVV